MSDWPFSRAQREARALFTLRAKRPASTALVIELPLTAFCPTLESSPAAYAERFSAFLRFGRKS